MIGIRLEDKSQWEGRVPLVPADLRKLIDRHDIQFTVQRSTNRAIPDADFTAAGARVATELTDCQVIMGVKEIPPEKFEPQKTYVFFSHTIKGQPANMPALSRLIELKCTLIDYEKIVDDSNRRLVFFGRFAGLAGMIDSLWALGKRLEHEGIDSPFAQLKPAHRYDDLAHYRRELATVADAIRNGELPEPLCPFVCGFAGYGQVSQGAQELYDLLPTTEVTPEELSTLPAARNTCYKVVFREEHLVARRDQTAPFELREYYEHPDRYQAAFFQHVPHLTVLMNCIYWEPRYPHLITRPQFQQLWANGQPRLRLIGDVTCDIDGSVACTTRATTPDNPVYTYDPSTHETHDGVAGNGPVVLAVDFLPCELPIDASIHFSQALSPFVPGLAKANFAGPLADSGLPPELQRATIVHNGKLTEPYKYLEQYLR